MGTLAASVRRASRALEAAGWDAQSAWLDAEVLARSILGWDLVEWLVRQDEPAAAPFQAAFDAAVGRRSGHEPIAYITGTREFYGREFTVSPAVLIPRPETELIVDKALAALAERRSAGATRPDVIDVGTGSGILAITVALEFPSARVVATDLSADALAMAVVNVRRFDVAPRVEIRRVSLLGDNGDNAEPAFDLVMSNPPYVSERDAPGLMPDVRDYEPPLALFGGSDGLDVIRGLIPAAARALRPGGWLLMEMGAGQADEVTSILTASPALDLVEIATDLAGIPRVLVARR